MFDFAENQTVESLDKVPSDFRGLYVEGEGGKYTLNGDDATVGSAVKAIQGLNKALKASRAEVNDVKSRIPDLSPLGDYGDTPEAIAEAFNTKVEELTAAAKGKQAKDVDAAVKAAQEAMAKAHAKDLEKATVRNEALQAQLYTRMVSAEATEALAKAGALNPALVLPFIEKQVKVSEEDGQFTVRVLDDKGTERFSGSTGGHLTIGELVQEMKADEQYAPLFKSEAPRGGGQRTTHTTGQRIPQGEKSAVQKIAAGLGNRK
jgi:hypothetical protein